MCGNEGSLTRRGNQGALALLALRQEACGRDLSFNSSHEDDLADALPAASPSSPESKPDPPAERPLRAVPPPKVRIKQERQLEQRLVDRACRSCSDTDSAAGLKHESEEPGGRQHAGQAFAALRAQAQEATAKVSAPALAVADFAPLPEFRAYLASRREAAQEGKARFAGLSTASEYAALVRVRREQDVHCIRKVCSVTKSLIVGLRPTFLYYPTIYSYTFRDRRSAIVFQDVAVRAKHSFSPIPSPLLPFSPGAWCCLKSRS